MNCAACPAPATGWLASSIDGHERPICDACITANCEPARVALLYLRNSGLTWAEMPEHIRATVTVWDGAERLPLPAWMRRAHQQLARRRDAEWQEDEAIAAKARAIIGLARDLPTTKPRRTGLQLLRVARAAMASALPFLATHWSAR